MLIFISHLTTLDPRKRVDSTIRPSELSCNTIPAPPCPLPSAVTADLYQTISYPRRLWQYTTSRISYSAISMSSWFHLLVARIAWGSPNSQLSQMLYVPSLSSMVQGVRSHGGGVAKYKWSPSCRIGLMKYITTFFPCLRFHSRYP